MAKPHPAAPDWFLLPPDQQQLETGWVGYRHTSGMLHWHHAASDEDRLSASIIIPTPVEDDSGVTHALEHMVLRGSMRYPDPETFLSLRAELALLEFNATTQIQSTRFHLTGYDPSSALRAVGFFADSVFSPQLADEDFEEEIIREQGCDFDGALYRELEAYIRNPTFRDSIARAQCSSPRAPLFGGMPDTLEDLDIVTLRRYHQAHYRPEFSMILTAGSWPMVALWQQLSKALDGLGGPMPVPPSDFSLQSDYQDGPPLRIHTLSYTPQWAAILHPSLSTFRTQQKLQTLGATLLPLMSDFQPEPALRFAVSDVTDIERLTLFVDDVHRRTPSKRAIWQSGYFCIQQGRDMVCRWGDGLQRLYHDFSITPFAPAFLKSDDANDLLNLPVRRENTSNGEWLSPCPSLRRMSILCRCNMRDEETRASLRQWLVLSQQRTLRWAWMQSKPMLGSMGEWQCANALVLGYTVDLPESDVKALRDFWHNTLSDTEISAIDGEWAHTSNGLTFTCVKSDPVFRTGAIMASHKDDDNAMHVTLSFPHHIDAGAIAVLGQAVMATSLVKKRRLGGRCYSFGVNLDLMNYELTFDTVSDSDPSVSFIALLKAFEELASPIDKECFERACRGGLGLVSARYNKSQARFHRALLGMVGQSVAVDFASINIQTLSQLATTVLSALKHPTVH
ncbi:insulinase family protein [Enterovibrio sp. ZSDZ35]|uniref:Insulinase family protein n=1 Tax=Enterovibrio qingdaonensis TaxID=2899818 RepID=A0ABT5QMR5_9GAMM|nr:insulinase family protein [Enterovibrio sp. ZSDZ35]MDD1781576.1 insulinase family protein [Enterovibrio sp. ZSDZ35]